MIVLLKLAGLCIDVGCAVDLCFTDFSHEHHSFMFHEVEGLDFLQIGQHGFLHERLW